MNSFFKKSAYIAILLSLTISSNVLAHPGRTDSKGGHWNRQTGTYHYHTGEYAGKSSSNNNYSSPSVESSKKLHIEEKNNVKDNDTDNYVIIFWVIVAGGIILYRAKKRK